MSTESKVSPTVLVLEDEPNLREMLVLVLRDAGCNEFIAKPVKPDELLEMVRGYTSRVTGTKAARNDRERGTSRTTEYV